MYHFIAINPRSSLARIGRSSSALTNRFDLIGFHWVSWHINHYRLFNAKSSLCIYIKFTGFGLVRFYSKPNHCRLFNTKSFYKYNWCIYFGLVWFYGISIIYIYIYIYMIWLGWVLCHNNPCRLFYVKSCSYIYIKYIWFGLVWFGFMGYQSL